MAEINKVAVHIGTRETLGYGVRDAGGNLTVKMAVTGLGNTTTSSGGATALKNPFQWRPFRMDRSAARNSEWPIELHRPRWRGYAVSAASDPEQPQRAAKTPGVLEAMMRCSIVFMLALLLCGCAMVTTSPTAPVLSPREVNGDTKRYDGREVVVRGFVVLGTNGRSLFQSKERFEEFGRTLYANEPGFNSADFDGDCLTLLNADILENNVSVFDGQTVTVRGRFESNYRTDDVLDLQACSERTALVLDERDTRRLLRALQRSR